MSAPILPICELSVVSVCLSVVCLLEWTHTDSCPCPSTQFMVDHVLNQWLFPDRSTPQE